MLTVAKVTGTQAAGYADYLEGKTTATAAGDYYLKDGERVEASGRWVAGASAVGCDPVARVTGEQLRALMDVRRPDSGRPLRAAGSTGEAVAAWDATFSAPKSVSAVWAIAGPQLRAQVERAHEIAVDRAIAYAAAQVPMVRERLDGQTVIHAKAREVTATGWRHTTSRAVENGLPDPQLHTHVLLHAAVRRDGQLVAIDSRQWLTHRRELGAAYRTELAHQLTHLGFAIQRQTGRGGRYFEIDGIPPRLLDAWSSRHHQVQEAIRSRLDQRRAELQAVIDHGGPNALQARERLAQLDAGGRLSAGEDRFLTHATRAAKQPVTEGALDAHWTTTAREQALTRASLSALRASDRAPVAAVESRVLLAALTEHEAMLTRSHARAIALEQNAGIPILDSLRHLAALRDQQELLLLVNGSLTTRQHRHREHTTAQLAERLAAGEVEPVPTPLITRHADRLDQQLHGDGGRLSAEQRQALALACGEGQLVVLEGQAGSGKSTVLAAVALAHRDAGQRIIITSTAALAAQRLAAELTLAGVNAEAHSTVALQHAITTGRVTLSPATTIIHDEAALASTRELNALLESVEASGTRIILVGDPRQSHPVGAGGLWPQMEHAARTHQVHQQLTHNLRAHDPADARDQRRFRDGEHEDALAGYQDRGRLHLYTTRQASEDAALEAAHHERQQGQRSLVVVQTSNDYLDELNARAQALRHQDGQLSPDSLALAGRPYQLHAGDQIQLRASLPHPHGTLRNGTTATITRVDPNDHTATITLGDDHQLNLTEEQLNQGQARLAYAQHPFPAQGTTTDTTHLIVGEHPTQEGTYVGLTRARDTTHIYAATERLNPEHDPLPQLAEQLSATDPDLPSISLPLAHEHTIQHELDRASRGEAAPATRGRTGEQASQRVQDDPE